MPAVEGVAGPDRHQGQVKRILYHRRLRDCHALRLERCANEKQLRQQSCDQNNGGTYHRGDDLSVVPQLHPLQIVHLPGLLLRRRLLRPHSGQGSGTGRAVGQMSVHCLPGLYTQKTVYIVGQQVADHAAGQIIFHPLHLRFSVFLCFGKRSLWPSSPSFPAHPQSPGS